MTIRTINLCIELLKKELEKSELIRNSALLERRDFERTHDDLEPVPDELKEAFCEADKRYFAVKDALSELEERDWQ